MRNQHTILTEKREMKTIRQKSAKRVLQRKAMTVAVMTALFSSAGYADNVRYDGLAGNPSATDISWQLTPTTPVTDPSAQPAVGVMDGISKNGAVDYKVNAAVGKVAVEVDKDGVPADGQSVIEVTVKLFDKQAQVLNSTAYITVEHSGGRILLPNQNTDEMEP